MKFNLTSSYTQKLIKFGQSLKKWMKGIVQERHIITERVLRRMIDYTRSPNKKTISLCLHNMRSMVVMWRNTKMKRWAFSANYAEKIFIVWIFKTWVYIGKLEYFQRVSNNLLSLKSFFYHVQLFLLSSPFSAQCGSSVWLISCQSLIFLSS